MRKKLTGPLPAVIVALASLAFWTCSDDDDASCETQYLTVETNGDYTTKMYYNEAQKLSAMVYRREPPAKDSSRTDLYYDANNRLTEVRAGSGAANSSSRYKFWYDGDQAVGIRRDLSIGITDSLAIRYDANGRIIQREYFDYFFFDYEQGHVVPRLHSTYTVEYRSDTKMVVNFFKPNTDTGILEPSSTFAYTLDGRKRPYPDEYYVLYLAWTNVIPLSNILQLRITDPDETTSVSDTDYSYNASQYPVAEKYGKVVTKRYEYACEPPAE